MVYNYHFFDQLVKTKVKINHYKPLIHVTGLFHMVSIHKVEAIISNKINDVSRVQEHLLVDDYGGNPYNQPVGMNELFDHRWFTIIWIYHGTNTGTNKIIFHCGSH